MESSLYYQLSKIFYKLMYYSNWLVLIGYFLVFNYKGRFAAREVPDRETSLVIQKGFILLVCGIGYFFYAFDPFDPARAFALPYRGFHIYPLFLLALALGSVFALSAFPGILLFLFWRPGENATILVALLLSYFLFHFENIPYSICLIPHVFKYYGVVTVPLSILAGVFVLVRVVRFVVARCLPASGDDEAASRRRRRACAALLAVVTVVVSVRGVASFSFMARPRFLEGVDAGIEALSEHVGEGVLLFGPTRFARTAAMPLLTKYDRDVLMLHETGNQEGLAEQIGRWNEQGREVFLADVSLAFLERFRAYVTIAESKVFALPSDEILGEAFSLPKGRHMEVSHVVVSRVQALPGGSSAGVDCRYHNAVTIGENALGSIRWFRSGIEKDGPGGFFFREASEVAYVKLAKPPGNGELLLTLTLHGLLHHGERGVVTICVDGVEVAQLTPGHEWLDYPMEIPDLISAQDWVEVAMETLNAVPPEIRDWDASVVDYDRGLGYGIRFHGARLDRVDPEA